MIPPKVSIIIPCFNAAPWLGAAIESCTSQTYPNIEVIIIDDGSSDDSVLVAERFIGPKVKLLRSPNRGASSARNIGRAAATGDFLQYLDADDFLSPDKIASQIAVLQSQPEGRLSTTSLVYFNDGTPPHLGLHWDGRPHADDCDAPLLFLLRLYGLFGPAGMVQTSQWLVPRSVSDKAGPWDESLSVDDDGEYFARIVEQSFGCRLAPKGCVYYRKHPSQGSLSSRWRRSEQHMNSCISAIDGKRRVLERLGANAEQIRVLAPFYCECALHAYPRFPRAVKRALESAVACGMARPQIRLPTPKGRFVQFLVGWRMARRIQTWIRS